MSRQTALIAIAIAVVLAGFAAIVFYQRGGDDDLGIEIGGEETAIERGEVPDGEPLAVDLYFPSGGGRLVAERHEIAVSESATEHITAVVEALLAGPRGTALSAPLPESVSVRRIYLSDGGMVFLDLESTTGDLPPVAGTQREMLTVYSLVNSVLLNFDDVDQLVLLWNGRQLETFGGHLDTMRPLVANTGLIATPAQ